MEQSYGQGADRFGPVSIGLTIALALLITVSFWIAQHPRAQYALLHRAPSAAAVRTALAWVYEKTAGKRGPAARRLSAHLVAGLALLVGWIVVAALAAGFTAVLEDVLEGDGIATVDRPALRWLAAHRDLWLTRTLRVLTMAGNPAMLAALTFLVCAVATWRRRSWLPAVLGLVGAGGIGLVVITAKALVGRNRPPSPYAVIAANGFSFPSGHATGTAAVTLLCAWMLTRWVATTWAAKVAVWTIAIGLIGVVGFSRVYLGVHYVGDVLAGWLLGAAWAGAVMLVGSWWDDTSRTPTPTASRPETLS